MVIRDVDKAFFLAVLAAKKEGKTLMLGKPRIRNFKKVESLKKKNGTS